MAQVEIISESAFKGFHGKLVVEQGNNVEVLIKVNDTQEFTYVGKLQDVKVLETV